jgi:hypothetical protein
MGTVARRVVLMFVVVDITFKVLVGLAFMQVMGGYTSELGGWTVRIVPPLWLLWLVGVMWLVRPIAPIEDKQVDGIPDAALRSAGGACTRLPFRLALAWSVHWSSTFAIVAIAAGRFPSVFALVCFLVALALGPYPLAHALSVWLLSPAKRRIDELAHARTLQLDIPRVTLRNQLLVYAFCLSVAPSAYMAAIGIGGVVQGADLDSVFLAINLGFGAVAVFAVLTTVLVANTLRDQ